MPAKHGSNKPTREPLQHAWKAPDAAEPCLIHPGPGLASCLVAGVTIDLNRGGVEAVVGGLLHDKADIDHMACSQVLIVGGAHYHATRLEGCIPVPELHTCTVQ